MCRPEQLAEIVIGSGGKHNPAELVLLGGIGVLDKIGVHGCQLEEKGGGGGGDEGQAEKEKKIFVRREAGRCWYQESDVCDGKGGKSGCSSGWCCKRCCS